MLNSYDRLPASSLAMYAGTGMYTLGEAARLIGVASPQLNRWLFGYHYTKGQDATHDRVWSPPLWATELSGQDFDEKVIGFHDLLEVRFVDALRRAWGAAARRAPLLGVCAANVRRKYPSRRFGSRLTAEQYSATRCAGQEKEGTLVDLRSRQHVFRKLSARRFTPALNIIKTRPRSGVPRFQT